MASWANVLCGEKFVCKTVTMTCFSCDVEIALWSTKVVFEVTVTQFCLWITRMRALVSIYLWIASVGTCRTPFTCVLGGWGWDILLQLCKDLHAFYMFSTHWQQFWEAPSSVPGLGGELQVCTPVCCRDFGTKVIQVKPLLKFLPKLLDDRDKNVREETKQLVIELYRWIGAALKPQMTNFKPIQVSSLNLDI